MVELRYGAGNVISPEVHSIGILALGSHLENHGPALPIDTDAKIASYLALESSFQTGAKFLGVLYAATEFDYIKHGKHISVKELVEHRLKPTLISAKKCLDIDKVVIVNGHGGNVPVKDYLDDLKEELDMEIVFNNKIVEIEGPHAGSGELSMGSILGILDPRYISESCDFKKYPEVGMCGFHEARELDEGIDKGAKLVESKGLMLDPILGHSLLDDAITNIKKDVKNLLKEDF
ncbi:2-amino-5-formylamino-6-ribosylaminopyrimidin-4(3H)-one 5'-monophosphate deformylase [Methanobacterium alcaliphilum]|uniref:2-amino-5-formylamino-6-ribosylaminopyrimidin- 4(3H)-one 5'-monophosphate deformylase n=1 Tax=Methanobacterium alcaliphilum TaxID=392018 RepID=UPI00200A1764|nr:2-amino-5-formylamino-6-ribosylaminopyrimidin-4(3H)-one 5'-monophosphate deformylase [Methanobacterium alcaliphilum]MCK9152030.1 2-amino-5-formylamino-6-ribosylaminopyrimidin-4(3H)-one 5'-monophosphate deformylase [Methanobacterium alcaliphilum]